jgi:hypothetical protein
MRVPLQKKGEGSRAAALLQDEMKNRIADAAV